MCNHHHYYHDYWLFIDDSDVNVSVVDNKETLEKLPNIEGLLSYRTDNKDLLLRGKHSWNRMAKENQVTIHSSGKCSAFTASFS